VNKRSKHCKNCQAELKKENANKNRMANNLRIRVLRACTKGIKSAGTMELTGCSIEQLKIHIQSQFHRGMHWNNYGTCWHIDHKIPCSAFDLFDPAQQRKCFHFTNLQPLWKVENLAKGDRIIPTQPELLMNYATKK
jgi:hypothetical protein